MRAPGPVARRAARLAAIVMCACGLGALASAQSVLETFEGAPSGWRVATDVGGGGSVQASSVVASSGARSARATTASVGAQAALRATFSDPGAAHTWEERPGTFQWHHARVYVPGTTLAQVGAGYLTLGRLYASGQSSVGWSLRVRQDGALSVVGVRDDTGASVEFTVYATLPANQWLDLELGLHSQAGPGVKRAFAFVLDGRFHGWYHQGRMGTETYDRAAIGIVESGAAAPLEVFVDDWGTAGTGPLPTGPDLRSTASSQEIDYRAASGRDWQIDWTTWANNLRLHPTHGLFSDTDRLQSGRNNDRMPDLTSGWAEIEIAWPKGTPPTAPTSYFGPMVGFRKEINREENFEVIPIGRGGGVVDLALEAWDGNGAVILGMWPLPVASIGGTRIPEPGDIIRARWEQIGASTLAVRASYYDASAQTWHTDIINTQVAIGDISGINFADGFHTASSVTIDSPYYAIRRYKVGTLATYPNGGTMCSFNVAPRSQSIGEAGGPGSASVTAPAGCAWSVVSNVPWVSVTGGANGVGSGTANWSVAPNTTNASRSGTITVAGQTVTVTQAASPTCSFGVQPTAISVGHPGGTGTVTVTSSASCAWTAVSNTPWLTVLSGGAGTGSGTVLWRADPNPTAVQRTGTLTVAGQTATVTQAPNVPTCSYGVAPLAQSVGGGGGAGTIAVTVSAGCGWSASTTVPWLQVTGHTGTGTGTVTWAALSNPTINVRAGTISVAGQAVTISQSGASVDVLPPEGFAVSRVSGSQVVLRWDSPAGGLAPTSYLLAGGTAPGATAASAPLDASSRATIVSLPAGVFYLRLHAVSGALMSMPSAEVRLGVGLPAPPSTPSGLVATVDGSAVSLAWRSSTEGGAPTGAVLDVGGAFVGTLPLAAVDAASFVGVPPGVYTLRVRATNASGASSPSNIATIAVPGVCSGPPLPPERLAAVAVGRTLSLYWDPATTGPAPTVYTVVVGGAFSGAFPTPGRSLGGGVGPGVYSLRVIASNACGQSGPSAERLVTVP